MAAFLSRISSESLVKISPANFMLPARHYITDVKSTSAVAASTRSIPSQDNGHRRRRRSAPLDDIFAASRCLGFIIHKATCAGAKTSTITESRIPAIRFLFGTSRQACAPTCSLSRSAHGATLKPMPPAPLRNYEQAATSFAMISRCGLHGIRDNTRNTAAAGHIAS